MKNSDERQHLLDIYHTALDAIRGKGVVSRYLSQHPLPAEPIALLAIGKAAESMTEGAMRVLGDRVKTGLLITKKGYLTNATDWPGIEAIEASHPVPDEHSLHAGQRLLDWLGQLEVEIPLLVLISGGTSSLVEVLADGVSLDDLQKLNQWLLASGLPIDSMNSLRRSLSLIKGGRLLSYLGQRQVLQLLISDVPEDDPRIIGSGPLIATANAIPDEIKLPDWFRELRQRVEAGVPNEVKTQAEVTTLIIANNRQACEAAAARAMALGFTANIIPQQLDGDVEDWAYRIIAFLDEAEAGVYIWGGETTVTLPVKPGRGGRNQQLALLIARAIAGRDDLMVLCAATDGTDGPTEDAGGLVDGDTVKRGQIEGFDVETSLRQADAGHFLEASGDLVNTGPTGSNVMDLVIAIKR